MPDLITPDPLSLTLAQGLVLMSWWKPILILLPIVPWAWVVSHVYDKHANMFALPRRRWNLIHMLTALAGFFLCILLPVAIGPGHGGFFAGWGVLILFLAADLVIYPLMANKDDRVTAKHKITLTYILKSQQAGKKKKEEKVTGAKVAYTIRAADDKGKFTIDVPAPQPETPELEVRIAAEKIYAQALAARAWQVDIQPVAKDAYGVSALIDGVRQNIGEPMPLANAVRIMDFWRAAAKLDVADRRRRQQNTLEVSDNAGRHSLRVTSIGVQAPGGAGGGMRTTLLFDPEKAVIRKTEELGLLPTQLETLKQIVDEGTGVVLLAAKPDNGRTTTFYAVTRMHDAYTSNVQTVEIDPLTAIEGVRTNKFDQAVEAAAAGGGGAAAAGGGGGEFSTLVRSILRRDPTVVSVAELPDAATAKEISKADHDRTRIYVSIPAPDALTAIQTWVKAVGDTKAAGHCVHGAIAQRLVRKLCTNCRVPYAPTPDLLKKLGLPEGKIQQLFRKGGQVLIKNKPEICPVCQGGGFLGTEGVFEVYPIAAEEREFIVQGNLGGVRSSLRKKQFPSIQQVAIRKAVDGVTSVEEVLRITAEPAQEGGSAQRPSNSASPPTAAAGKPAAAAGQPKA
ncbi:MAG: Flp pilus assembly complex ATPase component TadA [Phycisphaeraceae bacterium]|nr:Flp pilus assembly complex ATPase component TadA [Phycisphaeraceae bacterium]